MANTLIIADNGKVYRVTLGDPGEVVELKATESSKAANTLGAAQKLVDDHVHIAEVSTARVIMGTFVNLSLLQSADFKKLKE